MGSDGQDPEGDPSSYCAGYIGKPNLGSNPPGHSNIYVGHGEVQPEGLRLGQAFSGIPKPFIAAINGLAIAAGMELAAPELVAHFIVTTIIRGTPSGNQIRYKGRPSRYS